MKNTYKHLQIGFLIFFALIFNSCDDNFFEVTAPPFVEWKSVTDVEMGIANAYRTTVIRGANTAWAMNLLVHTAMSDIVRELQINGGWESGLFYPRETDKTSSKIDFIYRDAYPTIAQCNLIIDFVENNKLKNVTALGKQNLTRIEGEAYFLRAFAYYNLVVFYCPAYVSGGANDSEVLALRTTFPNSMEEALKNKPVKTETIYQQIISDLNVAKQKLPKKYTEGMHPAYAFGRAGEHAASFLLAKVYGLMGKYTDALTELNSIIDDPDMPRALESNPESVFLNNSATTPWNSTEVIWYGFYADIKRSNAYRHNLQNFYFFNKTFLNPSDMRQWWLYAFDDNTLIRCGMMSPDKSIPDSWKNDKRNVLYYRYEGARTEVALLDSLYIRESAIAVNVGRNEPVYLCDKYFRVPTKNNATTEPPQNIALFRLSEALLLRSAIKFTLGQAGFANDLNAVRARSWNTSTGGAYVPLKDSEVTWETIDVEWIKELAFESDRLVFLQMFQKPIGPGSRGSSVSPILPPYNGLYWQIPQSEIDFQ